VSCEKPDVGWTKVNVDASFSTQQSSGSWGAVARDHDGRVIASAWGRIEHCRSAQVCEAISCYEGLKLTINDTSNRIIIETGCQSLLSIFKPDIKDRSDARFIAEDFNRLVPEGKNVILSYKNRNANNLAHEIDLRVGSYVVVCCRVKFLPACRNWLCANVRMFFILINT
jgi:hypothetical protein